MVVEVVLVVGQPQQIYLEILVVLVVVVDMVRLQDNLVAQEILHQLHHHKEMTVELEKFLSAVLVEAVAVVLVVLVMLLEALSVVVMVELDKHLLLLEHQ